MTSEYRIELNKCNHCADERWDKLPEFEKDHPELRDERGAVKDEYRDEFYNFLQPEIVPCFVFTADCQGDEIRLCERHLSKILTELRSSCQTTRNDNNG